jgi:hypothetical protein
MAIAREDQGIGWLLAEEGRPRRFKAAYLTDHGIDDRETCAVTALRLLRVAHTVEHGDGVGKAA